MVTTGSRLAICVALLFFSSTGVRLCAQNTFGRISGGLYPHHGLALPRPAGGFNDAIRVLDFNQLTIRSFLHSAQPKLGGRPRALA